MLTIRGHNSHKGKIYVQIILKNVKDPDSESDPGSDPELSEKSDPGSDPKKIIPDPQRVKPCFNNDKVELDFKEWAFLDPVRPEVSVIRPEA